MSQAQTPRDPTATARRRRALAYVAERGFASTQELADTFGVSHVTIRTDLDRLAERGSVRRVRGGVVARGIARSERPFEETQTAHAVDKAAIGEAAAAMVRPGQTVLLDVGTTTAALARTLVDRADLEDVTFITNGLNIALALEPLADRCAVIVTGGTLRRMQHSLVEPMGLLLLDQLNADVAFIGCSGIQAAAGVTNVNLPEMSIKQKMMQSARRRVVLADGSKLGEVSFARVCAAADVDLLVTSASADEDELRQLRDLRIDVDVVESPGTTDPGRG